MLWNSGTNHETTKLGLRAGARYPHGPHMAHMTRECPAIAAIRGGGRMGGRVAPARHGLVSIVNCQARCELRRATSPVLQIKKAACPLAAAPPVCVRLYEYGPER